MQNAFVGASHCVLLSCFAGWRLNMPYRLLLDQRVKKPGWESDEAQPRSGVGVRHSKP